MIDALTAIIADDEKPLREQLQRRLAETWPELTIAAMAKNGDEAVALIEKLSPKIAFLDIKMPGISGIEVARQIKGRCHVVFVTSYDDFAVDAFDQEAIDYLVKPVSVKRLEETVSRLKQRIQSVPPPSHNLAAMMEDLMARISPQQTSRYLKWIKAPYKGTVRLVSVDDIYCFKAADKYTAVYSRQGEALINTPIKNLAKQLDPDLFWQVHRSTIIRVDRIVNVSRSISGRYQVKLDGVDEILTVSRSYTSLFRHM